MQFFDLSRQFNLNDILLPYKTLDDLGRQEWFLSKVRVEHNCLSESDLLEGQVVLKSNENIQIEPVENLFLMFHNILARKKI